MSSLDHPPRTVPKEKRKKRGPGRPPIDEAGAGRKVSVWLTPGDEDRLAAWRSVLGARGASGTPGPSAALRVAVALALSSRKRKRTRR